MPVYAYDDALGWVTITTGGTISSITSTGGTITVTNGSGPTTNLDLPNTGVAAGTYGDSTHTSQVTVDVEGRVTSASSVAISGSSGAGGLVTLFDSTLAAPAAVIDTGAGGVAAGHGHLLIFIVARSATASFLDSLRMKFNNDATNIYDFLWTRNNGGTIASLSVFADAAVSVGQVPGASAAANIAGPVDVRIPSYDQTTFYKVGNFQSGPAEATLANSNAVSGSFEYKSTTAISRIEIHLNSGANFATGTRLMVCGTQ